jgi:hypothetical protein
LGIALTGERWSGLTEAPISVAVLENIAPMQAVANAMTTEVKEFVITAVKIKLIPILGLSNVAAFRDSSDNQTYTYQQRDPQRQHRRLSMHWTYLSRDF